MTEIKQRYEILDILRGFALINMIAFHGLWDLINLEGMRLSSTASHWTDIWQQGICSLFILLSGFCWSLGKRHFRHGCVVFAAGILVSAVTLDNYANNRASPLDPYLFRKQYAYYDSFGICVKKDWMESRAFCFYNFFYRYKKYKFRQPWLCEVTRCFRLPENLYKGYIATYLGFTDPGFASTDYFSPVSLVLFIPKRLFSLPALS